MRHRRSDRFVPVATGLGIGIFSVLADGVLPGRLFVTLGNIASPWALVAFLVGYRMRSPGRGAVAGAVTLVVGVGTYYGATAIRGYELGGPALTWTVLAVVAGPIAGMSGGSVSSGPRPPISAVAVPAAILVAEALFLVSDRRIWRYDLLAEPYRIIDIGLMVVLLVAGLALPWILVREQGRRVAATLIVLAAGTCGAVVLDLLYRLIAR
jgi:hypothetical protein